jgi:hypothetical protein
MASREIEVRISDRLDSAEVRALAAFKRRAGELLQTRVLQSGGRIHANVKFRAGEGLAFVIELPEEEDLRSFYMAFRFFYLQKEPSNFLRVANIIQRHASHDLVNRRFEALKDQWHGAMERKGWSLAVNGEELTARLLIDLWFNAHYFHSDEDKEAKLRELNGILSTDFNRFLLADAVYEATKAALNVYESVKTMKL